MLDRANWHNEDGLYQLRDEVSEGCDSVKAELQPSFVESCKT
jgi:hypothetical protein